MSAARESQHLKFWDHIGVARLMSLIDKVK